MNTLLISVQNNLDTIGLKYLHYSLLKNGYNSFLLYLPHLNINDNSALKHIRDFVFDINPELIGISLMSIEYFKARNLTKYLKSNFKQIPIIWGGIHPTISPGMCLDYADYVCVGESERALLDIAKAIKEKKSLKGIKNLCYFENGKIKRNPLYPLIENLDEIPSYEHIPRKSFIQEKKEISPVDKNSFKRNARYLGTNYSVMSSRGCPFSCTYCCNNFISGLYQSNKIRRRSVSNIISELETAVNNNPEIKFFNFQDDCFLAGSKDYLKKFSKEYKEKIRRQFIIRSIPTFVTPEKIALLKDAGMSWISLGLQSGSDRVCKEIYKRKSLKKDFLRAAGIVNDFNIAAIYHVILDNPFEKEQDLLETVRTLIETPKPYHTQIFSLVLYLGTELYEKTKKECPEKIDSYLEKNYLIYQNKIINNIIRFSTFRSERYMNKIVRLYRKDSTGMRFKIILFLGKLLSAILFEPLNYLRIIYLSQNMSFIKTLKIMPYYFETGLKRYLNQFNKCNIH